MTSGTDPTDDLQRRFDELGYVEVGRVLDEDGVAELLHEEERFRLDVGYGAPGNQTLRVNIQLCHRSKPTRRFCTRGPHIPMIERLLGPDVCLTHQQFVTKLPDGDDQRSDIPWHQDSGYGRLDPMTDVTIWVPLVDTDERNGCLHIVPGSHRQGLLDHGAADVNPLLFESERVGEPIALPMTAGEGVCFSGLTLHGSGPNRSGRARPAFYVRYCEPGAIMTSEGGRPVLEDPHSWMVAGEWSPDSGGDRRRRSDLD